MRKIPAAAAEREEGQELLRRRRRRQRRRLKLPAWCSEFGRAQRTRGPGARRRVRGSGKESGGADRRSLGVARALCGDRGGTRAPRGAGHRDSGALPGHERWGRQRGAQLGTSHLTCLLPRPARRATALRGQPQPPVLSSSPQPLSHSILSVLPSSESLQLSPVLSGILSPPLAPRTPFLPSRVPPHYSDRFSAG